MKSKVAHPAANIISIKQFELIAFCQCKADNSKNERKRKREKLLIADYLKIFLVGCRIQFLPSNSQE